MADDFLTEDDEYMGDDDYADAEFHDDLDAGEEPELDAAKAQPDEDEYADAVLDDEERLRQPRAQLFRRRLRNQISMLPLALFLLALGGFLIARERDVEGLPNASTFELAGAVALALAFTVVFHALMFGRRERGMLFVGLWVWVTAGALALVVYGIDSNAQADEWWPLLFWTLGLTLVLTYLIERAHDVRLLLLSSISLVVGVVAYLVTSDRLDEQVLDTAADYWPLLFSVIGVILLPLAFRRRTG